MKEKTFHIKQWKNILIALYIIQRYVYIDETKVAFGASLGNLKR